MSQDARPPLRHDRDAGHPLITDPDGLTPDWVNAVLRRYGVLERAAVTGLSQEPIGHGMIGLNLRLTLTYDQAEADAPKTLVAKMAAQGAQSRESGASLNLYMRETRFYQELAPRITSGLPQTFFADCSEDGRTFCLLFEDMAPARMGDQLEGCGVEDARAAMKTAAALHAPLWDDAGLPKMGWIDRNAMTSLYRNTVPAFIPEFEKRFENLLEEGVMDVAKGYAGCIQNYFDKHDGPWTVSHQDYRLDNMLFDARGGDLPVAVLDWQTFVPGPGALDATYFNGAGLLAGHRREYEESLARLYHQELKAHGVTGYDWDRCWRDYRLHAAHGLNMSIVGAAITTPTERGDKMLSTMINRHAVQMIDLDTLALIREG